MPASQNGIGSYASSGVRRVAGSTHMEENKMTVCYYLFVCDDDLGECYGFFTKDKKKLSCIHWFGCNDATYRHEYMGRLFQHFGVAMTKLPESERLRSR